MTPKEKTRATIIAAVLTALLETEGAPSSYIYLSLQQSSASVGLMEYNQIMGAMVKDGFLSESNHYVTLTEKGKNLANEINKAIEEHADQ